MQCWTKTEMQHFLRLTADDAYGLLYELALKTGMRCGELLALRWVDVNLEKSWLTVHHDMRHTCATLALQDGAQPKAVSAQQGHSSVATSRTCTLTWPRIMEVDLADRMEALPGSVRV